ncbi:hypothetical protein ACQ4LE_006178 [Meloidogyne hapla]|uniref:F-box domain-containing protein n=1 Tax=Meloidogyne hapla TaxID=6305 RepID=A0A1I8B2I9_MELHA
MLQQTLQIINLFSGKFYNSKKRLKNMFNLPIEAEVDILKFLNFHQLISVRQTNKHFRTLIDEYENELARFRCRKISIVEKRSLKLYKIGNMGCEYYKRLDKFSLSDEMINKWQIAIDERIPNFICLNNYPYVYVVVKEHSMSQNIFYKLPTRSDNIAEMLIFRCWLECLSNCSFDVAEFNKVIFNPEIIKILFGENNSFQLNTFYVVLFYRNIFGLEFFKNHLAIYGYIDIDLIYMDSLDKSDFILNIFLTEGKLFPHIIISIKLDSTYSEGELHKLILNHIETSTNCSNIVSSIEFKVCWDHEELGNVELSKRAESIEKTKQTFKGEKHNIFKYKLSNINNPKIKVLISYFYNLEEDYVKRFKIKRIE